MDALYGARDAADLHRAEVLVDATLLNDSESLGFQKALATGNKSETNPVTG